MDDFELVVGEIACPDSPLGVEDPRFVGMRDGETCPYCGNAVHLAGPNAGWPGHVTNYRTGKVHEAHGVFSAAGPWGPAECSYVETECGFSTSNVDAGWDDWGRCDRVTCKNCQRMRSRRLAAPPGSRDRGEP